MNQLVLSLFPGIGLLDMAFEEEGFCVVRGPDLLWGGDIKKFHPAPRRFDGIIGGPPCQLFSRMRHIQPRAGLSTGNLIPEFERCIHEARPGWFLMENVTEAPMPKSEGYWTQHELVRDVWVGGETIRMRRFTFGAFQLYYAIKRFQVEVLALHRTDPIQSILAGGAKRVPVALGGSRKIKASRRICAGDSKTSAGFAAAVKAQGLPPDFDLPSFTVAMKVRALGNGVPLAMGRAVAKAVKRALGERVE